MRKPLPHGGGSKFIGYPDDFIHRRNDIFTTKKRGGVIIFTTWEKENQHYQIRDKRGRGGIFFTEYFFVIFRSFDAKIIFVRIKKSINFFGAKIRRRQDFFTE